MVLDRLKQMAMHVAGASPSPHPFDPLTAAEIERATTLVTKEHGKLAFNAVTLLEPRKNEMLAWLANPQQGKIPSRIADIVAIKSGGTVYDGLVDLKEGKILKWESNNGVQPLVCRTLRLFRGSCADIVQITMEDLQVVEHIARKDSKVIEQCGLIGIPKEDMHKVYCDRKHAGPNII